MPPQLELWRTGVSWWGSWWFLWNPWKPCQEPTHPYASLVGVVEDRSVLMGVPECHNQKANCLRSILSFYRPQKAFWTPKIWLFESCPKKGDFSPIFLPYPLLDMVWKAPAKRVLAIARRVLRGPYQDTSFLNSSKFSIFNLFCQLYLYFSNLGSECIHPPWENPTKSEDNLYGMNIYK